MLKPSTPARPVQSQGVRKLGIREQAPDCRVDIGGVRPYDIAQLSTNAKVLDVGCGHGWNRDIVVLAGGTWVGIEPFAGGAHSVAADAEALPFRDGWFDLIIVDAVLEHIPDVGRAFTELARVVRRDGAVVGYSAFMESFHEISYSHLSFKALEHYARKNGMKLEAISGGSSFGIDYHLATIAYPLPFGLPGKLIAAMIRGAIRVKSFAGYLALRLGRGTVANEARELANLYYKVECLRQSIGFSFIMRRQ